MKLPIKKYQISFFCIIILFNGFFIVNLIRNSKPFFLISPKPRDIIFESIVPKLDLQENTFRITVPFALIPHAIASSEYNDATSYIAIDNITGTEILEKDPAQSLPIASLTKLMTAVVALDLSVPSDTFVVKKDAARIEPTIIGVIAGQKMTVEELLHGMLMTSANDAAQVIQDGVNEKYHENIFAKAMNEKAQFIGLRDSHFDNPQGFDSTKNYSSAHDLALLAHYALTHYPLIADIVKKDYQLLSSTSQHKQFDLYNWNGLLDVYPNVYGVKIGNTDDAGATTIVASQREGHDVLVVLLGTPGILQRDFWASEILDDAFQKQFNLDPVNITKEQLRAKYRTWKYFQ